MEPIRKGSAGKIAPQSEKASRPNVCACSPRHPQLRHLDAPRNRSSPRVTPARSAPTARGNVTLIFALAIIPIFGAVAVAVDYSRGNSARTAMQAALDATTLMIAKEALDLRSTQVQQKAKNYFNAPVHPPRRQEASTSRFDW